MDGGIGIQGVKVHVTAGHLSYQKVKKENNSTQYLYAKMDSASLPNFIPVLSNQITRTSSQVRSRQQIQTSTSQLTITAAHTWIILPHTKNQHNHYYLVELERDHDTEAESEPDGTVEKEEQLAPSLARIGSQPETRARRRRRRRICYSRTWGWKCDSVNRNWCRNKPKFGGIGGETYPPFLGFWDPVDLN